MDMKRLASRSSDECGCPEEDWVMGMVEVAIHMEPDGHGEAFLDTGDWQEEKRFKCSDIEDLRNCVARYIGALPVLDI